MLNIPYNFDLIETKLYCLTTFNYLILMPLIYIIDTCLQILNVKFSLHSDKVKWLLWPIVSKDSFVLTAGRMNLFALGGNYQNTYKLSNWSET